MKAKSIKQIGIIAIAVIVIFYLADKISQVYIDWLWFEEIGYTKILYLTLTFKIITGVITGLIFFLLLYINLYVIKKLSPRIIRFSQSNLVEIFDAGVLSKEGHKILLITILLISLVMAFKDSAIRWQLVTGMWYGESFNMTDPIFGNDLGFYIFKLPLYSYLCSMLKSIFIIMLLFTVSIYLFYKMIRLDANKIFAISNKANIHISIIIFFIFSLISIQYFLERYYLLYSTRGVIDGAGYTDVHSRSSCSYSYGCCRRTLFSITSY